MKIVSRFPFVWPHLGFALVAGENEVEEGKIPFAAHAKLVQLSKPGPLTVTTDKDGKKVSAPSPAPISGYAPSKALTEASEAYSRKSAVKPPVATLQSTGQAPVTTAPAPDATEPEADHSERRERSGQRRG